MPFLTGGTRTGLLLLALTSSQPLFAGGRMPCLKAVTSKNGDLLVVVDQQQGSGQISLQVFPKENWINAKDRVSASAVFWNDYMEWSIILNPSNSESCPLPLITNDGEFLILLMNRDDLAGIVFPDREALRIYRRRDHIGDPIRDGPDHGVFIKAISFKEILPPNRFIKSKQLFSDESPRWFVGSSFDFSADNRQVIYKHGREDGIHINLEDGSVRKNQKAF